MMAQFITKTHRAAEFDAWLTQANKGDVAEYHSGNLAKDRGIRHRVLGKLVLTERSMGVNNSANSAWCAYEAGMVALVQARGVDGSCSYRAQRV